MTNVDHLLLMAILGHLVGDYLLQNKWMALGKGKPGVEGYAICLLHTLVYTLAVCLFTRQVNNPVVWGMVFLSHFPFDRWSLGQAWLNFIGGRNFMKDGNDLMYMAHASLNNMIIVTSFGCLVYAVVDNTIHIVLMYLGFLALTNLGLV